MTFVVAGGIVRNRAWVFPRHLEAVARNKPDAALYVTGDNNDATEEILREPPPSVKIAWIGETAWVDDGQSVHFAPLVVVKHDTGQPGYTRDASDGPRYDSAHMARERNLWASEALKRWPQATHLWVVDSDVLPEPDVLERLLALKAPVAAAFVPISDGVTPIHMIGWDAEKGQARRTGEEKVLTKPHVATLVGGCYLIDAQGSESPARWVCSCPFCQEHIWGEHEQGEDGYFAARCRRRGWPMLVDPMARCTHIMRRDDGSQIEKDHS